MDQYEQVAATVIILIQGFKTNLFVQWVTLLGLLHIVFMFVTLFEQDWMLDSCFPNSEIQDWQGV